MRGDETSPLQNNGGRTDTDPQLVLDQNLRSLTAGGSIKMSSIIIYSWQSSGGPVGYDGFLVSLLRSTPFPTETFNDLTRHPDIRPDQNFSGLRLSTELR